MAKQSNGINDGYRGAVGTVIGYEWRGKWCLRSRPRRVHNPRTERQQERRSLFGQAAQLAADLLGVLRIGLRHEALKRHRTPEYPAGWGPALAADERTGACIDVSDGLFSEANHLAGDSGVRIVLDEELLPVPEGLEEFARGRGLDPVELVGSSGEEYQLLFTSSASPGDFESILKETASRGALRRIGVVERGSGVCLRRRDGSVAAVGATGWSHF